MITQLKSASLLGISATLITVEVDARNGLPGEHIVGLPDAVIKESRNRVRTAIKNSGFEYPLRAYTINLAPAEEKKEGSLLELALVAAILGATGQLEINPNAIYVGELSLTGNVHPVRGIVAICHMAKRLGIDTLYLPEANVHQAKLISNLKLFPITSIRDLEKSESPVETGSAPTYPAEYTKKLSLDYSEVRGQLLAKRAVEIAGAGNHNILLIGAPGSGKSMILKRFPTILPPLSIDEAIETFKIHNICQNRRPDIPLSFTPPFRSPHHTVSYAGMVGGGHSAQPGEISLAHHGVLFLDELPEFQRPVIESLRQPMEDGKISVTRAHNKCEYPARFLLAIAMNPCPCGYYRDTKKECRCSETSIQRYWKKLSGPLLDRIDLIVEVPRLDKTAFLDKAKSQENHYTSEKIKGRIEIAREIQRQRQFISQKKTDYIEQPHTEEAWNARLNGQALSKFAKLPDPSQDLLGECLDNGLLTGRSLTSVIRVARTIADLAQEESITEAHVLEAIQFRRFKQL